MTITGLIGPVAASSTNRRAVITTARRAVLLATLLWLPAGFATPPDTASTGIRVPACQGTVAEDHTHAMDAAKSAQECIKWKAWKQRQQVERPDPQHGLKPRRPVLPVFTPPSQAPRSLLEEIHQSWLAVADQLLNWIAGRNANAAGGPIVIDGDLSDWLPEERIDLPLVFVPPNLATGPELYGKYDETTTSYILALKTASGGNPIGPNTTFYLNVDQNAGTGNTNVNGAEYLVNIFTDSLPYLYDADGQLLAAVSSYAYSADHSVLELAIPATSLSPLTPPASIDLVADINDTVFLPDDFGVGSFTLPGVPEVLPPRTDFNKRVGVVFCEATRNRFFDEKSYSQLFMSLQHQSMMAGIPFDLLTETDLTDIANIVNYDALIFPYCAYVPSALLDAIHDTLYKAVYSYGIGLITADNFMTNSQTGAPIPGDSYRYMKQLFGLEYVDGDGPLTQLTHNADDVAHPVMRDYLAGEQILDLPGNYFNYYISLTGQPVAQLATQTVSGVLAGTYPSLLATVTGGRHVHFASIELLGNSNLGWQALHWALYGDGVPVGLKMGRNNSLFLSRNDMDQSQYPTDFVEGFYPVHLPAQSTPPLATPGLIDLITDWKAAYNFVGSYYINIGTYPNTIGAPSEQWTDWTVSGPLYQSYVAMDNEIGTHSYSHPDVTDSLSTAQLTEEFLDSMNEISSNITPTWQGQDTRGAAVPGNPESLTTAQNILDIGQLDYLTGGYSGAGAGYPGAVGYLAPSATKVYFSPGMYFDFTLIQFGIPVGNPPVAVPLTAAEAEEFWPDQYSGLLNHASQAIVVWPWHDYGPTTSSTNCGTTGRPPCYSVAMYTNTIQRALESGAEFVTLADAAQRLATLKDANLTVDEDGASQTVTVTVTNPGVGKFAVELETAPGQLIQSVDNWYAYSGNKVFLDDDGGTFVAHLGIAEDLVTHISALPMRAKLISVNGDGSVLSYMFEGEGEVQITLPKDAVYFQFTGADAVSTPGPNLVAMAFNTVGTHSGTVTLAPDGDTDGVPDAIDNCPLVANPGQEDVDGDGIGDACDNCTLVANGSNFPAGDPRIQRDTDGDGFGNICDADLVNTDNLNIVNLSDYSQFRSAFGKPAIPTTLTDHADFNGDGVVNLSDYSIFRSSFGKAPGPSGLNP